MMPVSVNNTKITVKGSVNLQYFASFADCVYSSINISQANPLVQDKHIFCRAREREMYLPHQTS